MRADPYPSRTVRILQIGTLAALCLCLTILAVCAGLRAKTESLSGAALAASPAGSPRPIPAGDLYAAFAAAYPVSGTESAFSVTPLGMEAPAYFVTVSAASGMISRVEVAFSAYPSVGSTGGGAVLSSLQNRQQQDRDRCAAMLDVLFAALGSQAGALDDEETAAAAERVLAALDSGEETSFSLGAFLLTAAYADDLDDALNFCVTLTWAN